MGPRSMKRHRMELHPQILWLCLHKKTLKHPSRSDLDTRLHQCNALTDRLTLEVPAGSADDDVTDRARTAQTGTTDSTLYPRQVQYTLMDQTNSVTHLTRRRSDRLSLLHLSLPPSLTSPQPSWNECPTKYGMCMVCSFRVFWNRKEHSH